jgi:hypothetical protein
LLRGKSTPAIRAIAQPPFIFTLSLPKDAILAAACA